MKTATIKKSALALMACILALAFALVGCGGSKADPEEAFLGSWKLSGGEIYGEKLDDETIKTMEEWGLNCILILDEDGEGQLDLFGDVEDVTWKVKSDGTAKTSAPKASISRQPQRRHPHPQGRRRQHLLHQVQEGPLRHREEGPRYGEGQRRGRRGRG